MHRALVVSILLVVAACGQSTADFSAPASSSDQPDAPSDPLILEALSAYVAIPSDETLNVIIESISASADLRWVPYLVDLLRFTSDARLITPLADLTGVEPGAPGVVPAYTSFGRFMLDRRIDPGVGYPVWKSDLYATIDPQFRELLGRIDDPVLLAAIQWGGVPVGGVPELNDPVRVPATEAEYLQATDLVFGTVHNGAVLAYPLRILDVHELANDLLGGDRVALANCTLCRSGVLFSRVVAGQRLDFLTSGLLLNSNKVMVDTQTKTLWQQLTGEAIAGPLSGETLERLPLTVTTWQEWSTEHPDTDVLALPDGGRERGIEGGPTYESGAAYAGYAGTADLWFPALGVPEVFEEKAEVATIEHEGHRLAVELTALFEAGPTTIELGPDLVTVVPFEGGARFYLGATHDLRGAVFGEESLQSDDDILPRLISGQSFWFAWYGTFPDTTWWPEGSP
jgi:hypothetical protein